jgi:hypothetical protein
MTPPSGNLLQIGCDERRPWGYIIENTKGKKRSPLASSSFSSH